MTVNIAFYLFTSNICIIIITILLTIFLLILNRPLYLFSKERIALFILYSKVGNLYSKVGNDL